MGGKTITIPRMVRIVVDLHLEKYPNHVIAILVGLSLSTIVSLLEEANRLKLIPTQFKCDHCGLKDSSKHRLVFFRKVWLCGNCVNTIDDACRLNIEDYTYRKYNRFKDDT